MTCRSSICASEVISSSDSPSEKVPLVLLSLMSTNGSTAMDLLLMAASQIPNQGWPVARLIGATRDIVDGGRHYDQAAAVVTETIMRLRPRNFLNR